MEKEKGFCFKVKELLALCHILDDFEELDKNAVIFLRERVNLIY